MRTIGLLTMEASGFVVLAVVIYRLARRSGHTEPARSVAGRIAHSAENGSTMVVRDIRAGARYLAALPVTGRARVSIRGAADEALVTIVAGDLSKIEIFAAAIDDFLNGRPEAKSVTSG